MKLIIACDPSGGIGVNGTLPWKTLKKDLERFKSLTINHPVVMGKRTWDSLPIKPLPERLNIVVTQQRLLNYTEVLATETLDLLDEFSEAWIIGGATLINSCWDRITEIHLSRTFAKYDCDTHIDLVKLNDFTMISIERCEDHTYEIWKKT